MGKADWEQSAFFCANDCFPDAQFHDSFSLRRFVGDDIFFILSYMDSLPYKPMELITLETSE